ncbi:MAG TPA: hypothetical protein VHV51_26260 [Polyangiaceae bacterium]|jgi:hypothetical protein|nr:hypothetical protein [Polyangiaceae bacterium]
MAARARRRSRTFLPLGALALVACAEVPSRAPLGGNYAPPPEASAAPRKAVLAATPIDSEANSVASATEAEKPEPKPEPTPKPEPAPVAETGDVARYDPLKAGDRLRAEVSITLSAELQGGPPGEDSKLAFDGKARVEIKIVKSSAQTLDQLEVTLTPLSLHTEFGGQSSDSAQDPPQTYDVTLSGQTPSVKPQGGTLEKEDRAALLVFVVPLAEFHKRWAAAPTLNLKPGWSSKIPVVTPAFLVAPGDTVQVGPLGLRYEGRDPSSTNLPFSLELPVDWDTDLGKLHFDFGGKAVLGAKGRPTSLELSGPISGEVGAPGMQFTLNGNATFSAAVSYP